METEHTHHAMADEPPGIRQLLSLKNAAMPHHRQIDHFSHTAKTA